jgi:hypothetical protein
MVKMGNQLKNCTFSHDATVGSDLGVHPALIFGRKTATLVNGFKALSQALRPNLVQNGNKNFHI